MAWIETVSDDQADDELRALFGEATDPKSGEVDNILRIHSLHPAGLRAHLDLYRTVMTGTSGLRKVDREIIALAVSLENACHY